MNGESHRRGFRSERGAALVMTLMIIGLLITLATSLAAIARSDTMIENGRMQTQRQFYAAEGAVNRGLAEFKNIFLGFNVPTSSDFAVRSMNLGAYTVTYQLGLVPGYPRFVRIPAGQRYAGLNSSDYLYTNTAQTLGSDGSILAQVGAQSIMHSIPLFQFIAFYNNTLEIIPGPQMNLHGRIHTNQNLYLNSGSQLTVADQPPTDNPRLITTVEVTASGDIYRRGLDNTSCGGTVTIDTLAMDPATNDLTPRTLDCNGGAALSSTDTAPWLGALVSHVSQISVPPPSATVRGASGVSDYWPKADLRIVLDLTRTMQLQTAAPWVNEPCQGNTTPCLAVIEAQNANGSRNAAQTSALWQFMSENPGKIFYNDVPSVNLSTCYANCAADPTSYSPRFKDSDMVYREADDGRMSGAWTDHDKRLDYRRGAFFNNREKRGGQGTFMYLLDIDAQALLQWNIDQGGPLFPPDDRTEGGIVIFASVIGPGTNPVPSPPQPTNYGVRIFDSPVLPFPAGLTNGADPTGLTVVSDQAIYVEGNYNVKGSSANPTWNPAAFIGDTMNVLSQNWETGNNDLKSLQPLANRPAINTEINAAFIAGVDTTVVGNYNGGLENYPRFQEDWSKAAANPQPALTYRGSLVSFGNPKFSNGPWCGTGGSCDISTGTCRGGTSGANDGHCNTYSPPNRQWDYDGRFETAENLPPLNPRVIFAQQQLFDEQFR